MDLLKVPKVLNLSGNVAEAWRKFRQNFEIYLKAGSHTEKPEDVKVAILLNSIGEDAVELFNTFQLTEAQRNNLTDVLNAFENYANPRRNIVIERYLFNSRNQEHCESFDEFVTDLRKLIKNCEYGTLADSIIQDRIVIGINDKPLQERLLREPDLTLQKTIDICRATELSKKQSEVINRKSEINILEQKSAPVDAVSPAGERKTKQTSRKISNRQVVMNDKKEDIYLCKKCNYKHGKRKCPAFGKICRICKQKNHFAVGCKSKSKSVNNIEDKIFIDSVFTCNKSSWIQKIQVGDKIISVKLDSGSSVNIISYSLLKSLKCNCSINSTDIILETYGGNIIKPLGITKLECKINNCTKYLDFVVVNCNTYSRTLLGLPSCAELGLIKRQIIDHAEVINKAVFIEKNKDVFQGLGTFNLICSIKIDNNAKPVARPLRRIPESLKPKLKEKLTALEKDGIISRVENPDGWVNNLVIVEKPDKSIRVCLDPQDLNKVIKKEYQLIPTVDELMPKLCNKSVYSVFDLKDGFYQIKLDESSSKLCQFSTPFGCFKFNRLPFGISVAPELFQKANEKKNSVIFLV